MSTVKASLCNIYPTKKQTVKILKIGLSMNSGNVSTTTTITSKSKMNLKNKLVSLKKKSRKNQKMVPKSFLFNKKNFVQWKNKLVQPNKRNRENLTVMQRKFLSNKLSFKLCRNSRGQSYKLNSSDCETWRSNSDWNCKLSRKDFVSKSQLGNGKNFKSKNNSSQKRSQNRKTFHFRSTPKFKLETLLSCSKTTPKVKKHPTTFSPLIKSSQNRDKATRNQKLRASLSMNPKVKKCL